MGRAKADMFAQVRRFADRRANELNDLLVRLCIHRRAADVQARHLGALAAMPTVKHKVFAYITSGTCLLVFRHTDFPEAGLQVPAGTLEEDEHPDDGVLREAAEETGLSGLRIEAFLGEQERNMVDWGRDEIHHRRFYHLRCTDNVPETWRHGELFPTHGDPIEFEFFWVQLPYEVPVLIADHGALLPVLWNRLSGETADVSRRSEP
jgi:8-oxo-dGTP diphosphatase